MRLKFDLSINALGFAVWSCCVVFFVVCFVVFLRGFLCGNYFRSLWHYVQWFEIYNLAWVASLSR